MRRNSRRKDVLLGALFAAALAALSPAAASAQIAPTTEGSTTEASGSGTSGTTTKTTASYSTTAVTSVGLNNGVTGLASDANGNVYASLQYSNKVAKLNGTGTVVGTFAVGRNPTGLVVDNSNGGVLYVLNNSDNTVTKLKLDGTLVATYKVAGDGPVHAVLYGGTLYIACERSNTLVRLRTDGVALGSTAVGKRPVWVAVGGSSSGSLSTSEDSTMLASAEPTEEPAPADSEPAPADSEPVLAEGDATLASSPGSGSGVVVYVSCNKSNEVWKLSTSGGMLGKYATPRGPFGLAVNSNGEVLVACFWDAVVYRMSSSGVSLSKTPVGDGAAGVVAYGNVLAVISNGTNSLTRLSLTNGSVISKELVDRAPLTGTATSSSLWVGCTGSGTIAKRAL